MDEYLTVTQAAESLGLSTSGVRVRLERGVMLGRRIHPRLWLVPKSEVERWQQRGKLRPGPKPSPGAKRRRRASREAPADAVPGTRNDSKREETT
jgi:excisionase family DNA binding protein